MANKLPLEYDVLQNGAHRELGESKLWGHKIRLVETVHKRMEPYDGLCIWFRGKMTICFHPRVTRNLRRLQEVFWHEATHAVEYLNDPEFLTATHLNGCSMLAQAMEEAISQLQRNLRWEPDFQRELAAKKRKIARRGRSKPKSSPAQDGTDAPNYTETQSPTHPSSAPE